MPANSSAVSIDDSSTLVSNRVAVSMRRKW
jgi:hypothetical protein